MRLPTRLQAPSVCAVVLLLQACPAGNVDDAGVPEPVCAQDGVFVGRLNANPLESSLQAFLDEGCTTVQGELIMWPDTPPLTNLILVDGDVRVSTAMLDDNAWDCCRAQLPALVEVTRVFSVTGIEAEGISIRPLERVLFLAFDRNTVRHIDFNFVDVAGGNATDADCELEGKPPGCISGGIRLSDNEGLETLSEAIVTIQGELTIEDNSILLNSATERLLSVIDVDNTEVSICGNLDQDPCP